jgi:hypothetical protein
VLALTLTEEEWRALEGILKNKTFAARLLRAYIEAQEENVRSTFVNCSLAHAAAMYLTPIGRLYHLWRCFQVSPGEAWRKYAGENRRPEHKSALTPLGQ